MRFWKSNEKSKNRWAETPNWPGKLNLLWIISMQHLFSLYISFRHKRNSFSNKRIPNTHKNITISTFMRRFTKTIRVPNMKKKTHNVHGSASFVVCTIRSFVQFVGWLVRLDYIHINFEVEWRIAMHHKNMFCSKATIESIIMMCEPTTCTNVM